MTQSIIFRRYRKGKDGQILDARKYGKRAWPIRIESEQEKGKQENKEDK